MHQVTVIDWARFDRANAELARRIRASRIAIDTIVAINRGGAVSGVCMAHLLGISDLITFTLQMMKGDAPNAERGNAVIGGTEVFDRLKGRRVLLVDDAVGSGLTLEAARRELAGASLGFLATAATIWNTEEHDVCPATYHGDITPGWVLFPWEVSELPRAGDELEP